MNSINSYSTNSYNTNSNNSVVTTSNVSVNSLATHSYTSELVQDSNKPASSPATVVNISEQALEKLANEQKSLGQELTQKAKANDAKQAQDTEVDEAERFDKMIESIEEKIKEVQNQLRQLNGKKSEEAQAERKALESKLVALNATLVGLLAKKLESVS